ncbi:MAG: hypothetical protein ACYDG8_07990, partial [Vulcanimicrobiaceae bacterium]
MASVKQPGARWLAGDNWPVAQTQAAAAAKAGVSERSARRIESLESLPSQRPPRRWRTRQDPL